MATASDTALTLDIKNIHLRTTLNLADVKKKPYESIKSKDEMCQHVDCFVCYQTFQIINDNKNEFLTHLIKNHRLVISDVNQIGDMKKYSIYWKERFQAGITLADICFEIHTNTNKKDKSECESYYLLSENLPEEKELREKLNIYRLEKVLKQQEIERNDNNYHRKCLFCVKTIGNTKALLLNHMLVEHNFNMGLPDNLVYFDEFYERVKERIDNFQCLFCSKVFYDKQVLKEHMRKKQHKCINPLNKEFDKFYIINYLEPGKQWKDLKHERDSDDFETLADSIKNQSLDDWTDEAIQTYFCLFCDDSFDQEESILGHMIDKHGYDLRKNMKDNDVSFYNQVKLINYIRRQVLTNVCFVCKQQFDSKTSLVEHLDQSIKHINEFPPADAWDRPEYYFPTFEDDTLLCLLDDSAYVSDEAKFKVIPEQYDFKVDDELVNYLLTNNIHDLKFSNNT